MSDAPKAGGDLGSPPKKGAQSQRDQDVETAVDLAEEGADAVARKAAQIVLGILAQAELERRSPPPDSRRILSNLLWPGLVAIACVGISLLLSSVRMSEADLLLEVEQAEAVQIGFEEATELRLAPVKRSKYRLTGRAADFDLTDKQTQSVPARTDVLEFKADPGAVVLRVDPGTVASFHMDAPHVFSAPSVKGAPVLQAAGVAKLVIEVTDGGFELEATPNAAVIGQDGLSQDGIDDIAWRATSPPSASLVLESGTNRTGFLHLGHLRVSQIAFSRSSPDTGTAKGRTSVCTLQAAKLRFPELIDDSSAIAARTCLRIDFKTAEISDLEIDESISFVLRGRISDISMIDPTLGEDVTVDLMPSLMQFVISDRSLNSQWLIVVFLWGAIWSAIRLAVSGRPS